MRLFVLLKQKIKTQNKIKNTKRKIKRQIKTIKTKENKHTKPVGLF